MDVSSTQPRISMIIPAYNEEAYLPKLLDTVAEARRRYQHGPDAIEVIVVDNGSSDATASIAAKSGAMVVREERHLIAAVRNAGALVARGTFLAFIDADSQIHPETFIVIDRRLSDNRTVAGTTGVRLDRWSLGLLVTYVILIIMIWITRMDTGVVFCRRSDFKAVGGYDETKRIAEDVQILFDLKRLGRGRRQRLVRATEAKALASMRKFDRHGDWFYLGLIWRYLYGLITGREMLEWAADKYWYDH